MEGARRWIRMSEKNQIRSWVGPKILQGFSFLEFAECGLGGRPTRVKAPHHISS